MYVYTCAHMQVYSLPGVVYHALPYSIRGFTFYALVRMHFHFPTRGYTFYACVRMHFLRIAIVRIAQRFDIWPIGVVIKI